MSRGALAGVLAALALALTPAAAQTPERLLTYGITGSVSSEGFDNPTVLLGRLDVQRAVLAAARAGLSDEEVRSMLAEGGELAPEHLVGAGIFRTDAQGRYRIAFNLVTAEDRARIDAVIAPYAESLANAVLARRRQLNAQLARYDLASADRDELAFFLIGCVGLDWDGLDLTAEMGLRAPARAWPNGDRFTLWAREQGPDVNYRGLYWGSHNARFTPEVWTTTFGDHDALPRSALPDAVNELSGAINRSRLAPAARRALARRADPLMRQAFADAAKVMLALRDGPLAPDALAARAGLERESANEALTLLEGLAYVRQQDGVYAATIVVLTSRDGAMIESVRGEIRAVMRRWLGAHAERLREDLSDLSAIRSGVAYEEMFTEIWHYLFGAANFRLSQSGVIADPYAEDSRFRGFVPVVWESALDLYE